MIKIVLIILVSILAGFAAGRRLGLAQGFQAGMAYGLLDARRRSLEEGCCPICDSRSLAAGSDHDQETPDCAPDVYHDSSLEAVSEDGTAGAQGGEFGPVVAGCFRQVLNLLMGAFSMP
ncbi:MAG: hypothetical protein GX063_00650 [Firmicutes bacterium]|nr:hypothetical protein [Bacillota bacterium]